MSGDLRIGKTEIGIKLKSVARDLKSSKAQTHYCSPCCNAKVGRKNYCKECGQELSRSDINLRFFDTGNEKVILKKEEIGSLKDKTKDKTFEVEGFIREGSLPRIYTKKSYFVVPKEEEKNKLEVIAKGLLLSGRAMVGTYVYRNSEKLAMITTSMGGLVLHNLFWEQGRYDIPENFKLIESGVIPDEEEVPQQIQELIEVMSGEFEYADYESDYYENFKELVLEAKDRDVEKIEEQEVVSEEAKTEKDFLDAISEEAETQEKLQEAEVEK